MISECKICSCNNFISNRWKKSLCINCYHSHLETNDTTNDTTINEIDSKNEILIPKITEKIEIKKPKNTYMPYISYFTNCFSIFSIYLYSILFRNKKD